jgi:FtsH-binding integral membrane protein
MKNNILASTKTYDEGLRNYMMAVYRNMSIGLILTFITAYLFGNSPYGVEIMTGGGLLKWAIILAPLAFIFFFDRFNGQANHLMFSAFSIIMGLSMSLIFMIYTDASIVQTFFATSAAFAGLSLWGYTTKKDLSNWGTFLIMGLIGLIVVSLINIFIGSSLLASVLSGIGVLIFSGLTAYETQTIKSIYFQRGVNDDMDKIVISGALGLYLSFINLFQSLLHFIGERE